MAVKGLQPWSGYLRCIQMNQTHRFLCSCCTKRSVCRDIHNAGLSSAYPFCCIKLMAQMLLQEWVLLHEDVVDACTCNKYQLSFRCVKPYQVVGQKDPLAGGDLKKEWSASGGFWGTLPKPPIESFSQVLTTTKAQEVVHVHTHSAKQFSA